MQTTLQITRAEFRRRAERLLEHLRSQTLSGVVLFDSAYVHYFSGFAFIPTERPIAFVMNAQGEQAMFVPRLELEHARAQTGLERVEHYVEYPYTLHPAHVLARLLADMGIARRIGADSDGYPWIFGYRGPALSETTGATVVRVTAFIEDLMMIKSPAEIALIKESAKWGNLAHRLLQRYTRAGVTETEVSLRASQEATLAMLETLGPLYASRSMYGDGASAGYRGQIGRNAAIPHALANNITFQAGDVLVTGAGAPMWGYNSELERTMVIGGLTDEQKRLFDHMVALQDLAIRSLRPGVKCSDVDRAVRAYFEQHDLMPYWKHHTGHAIGLRYHEAPFLDVGDDTEIKPGMVFTVEPGLYAAHLGGFRHSDTVVITEDGHEVITYYPRDLASLTIPV
ncbi:MAG: aminopeptidase P family protein [Chloroflexi bacterium]|jgi:Xaa-Pro aminopeptidase|uniref:Aminopeptidase P family protein n=1 Tax=Candidatus Thermofonsia Clade 3 bacterium TaxID=2364212 RepID=A0A2M8QBW2_9CHLR|nr:Xaa-Pro peptidase family protein [Candidatus Roseilinea sp. NK_OTU-006]PJF47282.1 MAG: aminopeptidase P family protein [Candidatus Thermofonsia Clade 3 bacterium]RMG62250.1 MAG: aminopeptidase P family protein [Chloroflexota bacterium]